VELKKHTVYNADEVVVRSCSRRRVQLRDYEQKQFERYKITIYILCIATAGSVYYIVCIREKVKVMHSVKIEVMITDKRFFSWQKPDPLHYSVK